MMPRCVDEQELLGRVVKFEIGCRFCPEHVKIQFELDNTWRFDMNEILLTLVVRMKRPKRQLILPEASLWVKGDAGTILTKL